MEFIRFIAILLLIPNLALSEESYHENHDKKDKTEVTGRDDKNKEYSDFKEQRDQARAELSTLREHIQQAARDSFEELNRPKHTPEELIAILEKAPKSKMQMICLKACTAKTITYDQYIELDHTAEMRQRQNRLIQARLQSFSKESIIDALEHAAHITEAMNNTLDKEQLEEMCYLDELLFAHYMNTITVQRLENNRLKSELGKISEDARQDRKEGIQAREKGIQAYDNAIQARDESIQAREEGIQAYDNAIQAREDALQAKFENIKYTAAYTATGIVIGALFSYVLPIVLGKAK